MDFHLPKLLRLPHPPVVGILVSVTALGLFSLIASQIGADTGLSQFDRAVAERLAAHRQETPWMRSAFWFITQFGDVRWFFVFAFAGAVVLTLRHQVLFSIAWVLTLLVGGILDGGLKDVFQRPRPTPPLRDEWIHTTTTSFPSGHSVGSEVAYVFLAYLLVLVLPQRWARYAVAIGLGLLILGIGFSRMYLGAHWSSDVAGGFLIGAAWVSLAITVVESIRRRRQ